MSVDFSGQWIGNFKGTNSGLAVLDLDSVEPGVEGRMYAFDDDPSMPSVCSAIRTQPTGNQISFAGEPQPFSPNEGQFLRQESLQGDFPTLLKFEGAFTGEAIEGTWETDIDTSGTFRLVGSRAGTTSAYQSSLGTISWKEFQDFLSNENLDPHRYIFRGQSKRWRLRTSFHRTKRKDIYQYWNRDVPRLRNACVNTLGIVFDPQIAEHNGALLHVLQHFGYPTPLLDWTYSPYVAAYFAFSASHVDNALEPHRIFMFDKAAWENDFPQFGAITLASPHFSTTEPLSLGNPRALPQQSVATLTNLDDLEAYIQLMEERREKSYLKVIDVSPKDRVKVLQQLSLMGISVGSLFPGMEGMCAEYRIRDIGY